MQLIAQDRISNSVFGVTT